MTTNIKMLMHIAMLTPMKRLGKGKYRWGAPFLLMGPPGVAKTSIIMQVCERMIMPAETMYLSTHQPEDLSGIPVMVSGEGKLVNFVEQISRCAKVGTSVLVLDELTTARETTQNAGMGLVLERCVAGNPLPPGLRIAAAANPPAQAAAARDLSLPAANRFLHFDVDGDSFAGFCEYMAQEEADAIGAPIPPFTQEFDISSCADGEATVMRNWSKAYPRAWGMAKGFHVHAAGKLNSVPPIGSPARGRAWPSSRSWDMGVRAMATADALAHGECALDLLTAAVGLEPATEYAEWAAKFDLPAPIDVITGKWRPDKLRNDIATTAFHTAIVFVLAEKDVKTKHKLAIELWSSLGFAAEKCGLKDVVIPNAETMVQQQLSSKATNPALWAAAVPVLNTLDLHVGDKHAATARP